MKSVGTRAGRLGGAAGVLAMVGAAAAQPTALDTFGPGNTYEPNMFLSVRGLQAAATPRLAHSVLFTSQAGGAVQEITTVLRHVAGGNDFTIQLREGDSNQVGPVLGSWDVDAGPAGSPIITIPVGGTVTLLQGETYHIAAIGAGDSDAAWHQNNQGMMSIGWATSTNGGITFLFVNGTRIPATRITLESTCYPDCDGDGSLTLADFGCFQTQFALGNLQADCDGDGVLTLADFGCFQTQFALGCP